MGQDVSKPAASQQHEIPVLTFPEELTVPDELYGAPAADEPPPASSAKGGGPTSAADGGGSSSAAGGATEEGTPTSPPQDDAAADRSLDQLPAMPPTDEGAGSRSVIIRNLGDYRLEKQVLGEGAFGKVRLATSARTGHRVAVKVIKVKKLNERAELLLQREVKHHEKLRHANIVRLHTFIMTPSKFYLVMEYCEGACAHTARASRRAASPVRPVSRPVVQRALRLSPLARLLMRCSLALSHL